MYITQVRTIRVFFWDVLEEKKWKNGNGGKKLFSPKRGNRKLMSWWNSTSCLFCSVFRNNYRLTVSYRNSKEIPIPITQVYPMTSYVIIVHYQYYEIDTGTMLLTRLQTLRRFHQLFTFFLCLVYSSMAFYHMYKSYNHCHDQDTELSHHHRGTPFCYPFSITYSLLPSPNLATTNLHLYNFVISRMLYKWDQTAHNNKYCMGYSYTKKCSLFIWNSNLTRHPAFYLALLILDLKFN